MNSQNLFSQRFFKLIWLLGASKKNIAAILGVSPSHITQLTTDKGKGPSPALTKLIAMTFEVSEEWLTGELAEGDIFGYSMSKSEYEARVANLRVRYKGLSDLRTIASSVGPGEPDSTAPNVEHIAPKSAPIRLSELNNLQREWIEIGLKMGDLEMLEWLVKIKKGHQ